METNTKRYTTIAIILHWIMALLIISAWIVGILIDEIPKGPLRITTISWHKWVGITIMFLWLARSLWRITHRPPDLNVQMPAWQTKIMHLTHITLYVLMLAIPVTGWLMSSAKGYTVNYFGLFDLPDFVEADKTLGHTLKEVHEFLANSIMALIGIHILGAMKHQFLDKDGLLLRMSLKKK
jgi:cytochrome b561